MLRNPEITALLLAFAVVSCGAQDSTEPNVPGTIPQAKDDRSKAAAPQDAALQSIVDGATEDLRARLQGGAAESAAIEVIEARRVTWRTSALGCPMPDRGYLMVLTPGVLIRLRAGGETYEYHGTPRGPAFLCEPPGRIETPAPGGHSQDRT